jgi:hypothetical protein
MVMMRNHVVNHVIVLAKTGGMLDIETPEYIGYV